MEAALVAAGHDGAQQGDGVFIKPSTLQEINFYQWITAHPSALNEFVPQFMGTLTAQMDVNREMEHLEMPQSLEMATDPPYLVLEDVCAGFSSPAIMDVKLGSQLWDDQSSLEKRMRLQRVAESTTSGSLKFRIAGLNVVNLDDGQRQAYGKEFGRQATRENITEYLRAFWPDLDTNIDVRDVCLGGIIARLEELEIVLSQANLAMHSASVFLVYEGDRSVLASNVQKIMLESTDPLKSENSAVSSDEEDDWPPKLFDVRLIDFAHTKLAECPDQDTLGGVRNLITELKKLASKLP